MDRLGRLLTAPPVLAGLAVLGIALAVYSALSGLLLPTLLGIAATVLVLAVIVWEKPR